MEVAPCASYCGFYHDSSMTSAQEKAKQADVKTRRSGIKWRDHFIGECDPCYGDVPANCFDGQLSGNETDVDCRRSCEPCPGGGGGTCDGTGDCNACTTCAQNDPCANETNACAANPDCGNLLNCVYTCADQQCITDCYATYPAGNPDFTNYDSCVTCTVCYNDCGGMNFCP